MKIIKMNVELDTLKAGGGTPVLTIPKTLDGLENMKSYFASLSSFLGTETFALIHKTKNNSPIPAPSSRFIDPFKLLLADNKMEPLQTKFNQSKNKLEFLYELSYLNIKTIIQRLEYVFEFIDILKENFGIQNTDELFMTITESSKDLVREKIKEFSKLKQINLFSYTRFVSLLSSQESIFGSIEMLKESISNSGSSEKEISFVSVNAKEEAAKKFDEKRVSILLNEEKTLTIGGNFNGELSGVTSVKDVKNVKVALENSVIEEKIRDAVYGSIKNTDEELLDVMVGVIDGGISETSILRREINVIENDVFGGEKPTGSHAEGVCSLLAWANKLSDKTKDFIKSPKVKLFDVITQNDNLTTFKQKVRKIISENFYDIKIWNISITFANERDGEILSQVGVFLDSLQKQYGVLIIIPTGNISPEDPQREISAPSGSFLGLSVSAVKSNNEKVSYAKEGYGTYLNEKPDLAIFGGDIDDTIRIVKDSAIFNSSGGTSFAAPLIARKAAYLLSEGFDILAIPAILNNYAAYYSSKNSIEQSHYIGNGVIPVDSNDLIGMLDNKAIVLMEASLSSDYYQGFMKMEVPKYMDKYDAQIYSSINVSGRLAGYATYEYVLDSSTFSLGRIDPFTEKVQDDTKPLKGDDARAGSDESALRIYKGKFKTRNTRVSLIQRPRLAAKTNRTLNTERNIDKWGVKFVRNLIGSTRAKATTQKVALCIIFESENPNFYNEFINLNKNYITNINQIRNINENENELLNTQSSDDIQFS